MFDKYNRPIKFYTAIVNLSKYCDIDGKYKDIDYNNFQKFLNKYSNTHNTLTKIINIDINKVKDNTEEDIMKLIHRAKLNLESLVVRIKNNVSDIELFCIKDYVKFIGGLDRLVNHIINMDIYKQAVNKNNELYYIDTSIFYSDQNINDLYAVKNNFSVHF